MKKQDQTVENMIMQAHYLEALEIESKTQKPLAEMERQDFINTITELKAMISSLKLTIDTLDDKLAERYDSVVAEVNG